VVICGVGGSRGDIQVLCEPGLRVYVDGELAAISARLDDGAYLMDVSRGLHTVRVEKDGFVPQSFEVLVGQVPVEVAVGEFQAVAAPARPEEPALGVGTLVVTSAPQNCVVEVDGTPHTKTSPRLTMGVIAAGDHTIRFTKPGYESLSKVVTVQPGATVAVHGNLKAAQVDRPTRDGVAARGLDAVALYGQVPGQDPGEDQHVPERVAHPRRRAPDGRVDIRPRALHQGPDPGRADDHREGELHQGRGAVRLSHVPD
jgi:hypothetical protein